MEKIAFDTETHLITPGNLTPKLVCISFYRNNEPPFLQKTEEGLDTIQKFLEDERLMFVGHNVAFDFGVIAAARPSLMPLIFKAYAGFRVFDTKIREELNDIARGRVTIGTKHMVVLNGKLTPCDYSLAGLARRYLNKDRSADKENPDSWRFRYAELENVPLSWWPEDARKYALEDAEDTYNISMAQTEQPPDEFTHANAAWALHLMSAYGIRTDGEAVAKLEIELLSEQKKNRARLIKAGILKGKKMTPKELREGKVPDYYDNNKPYRWAKDMGLIKEYVQRVYSRRGMKPPLTETGNVATDKDTLNESGSLLLSLLSDAGGVDKILQTYVPVLKQGIHTPINARFNVLVSSGRTSCLAWWTPVKTKRGFVAIKDVQVGDEVWTHKARWRKVTAVLDQGIKETVSVSLCNGSLITCTDDHRFLTNEDTWQTIREVIDECFKEMGQQPGESTASSDISAFQGIEIRTRNGDSFKHDRNKYTYGAETVFASERMENIQNTTLQFIQDWQQKSNVGENNDGSPQLEGRLRRRLWLPDENRHRRKAAFCSSNSNGASVESSSIAGESARTSHRRKSEKQRIGQSSFSDAEGSRHDSFPTREGQRFVEIEEIYSRGSIHVFDISVEEDESFEIEGGIFAHNCQNPNLQNLPTGRRVSGVRECFVPRETVEVVEVPDDYVLQEGEEWDE